MTIRKQCNMCSFIVNYHNMYIFSCTVHAIHFFKVLFENAFNYHVVYNPHLPLLESDSARVDRVKKTRDNLIIAWNSDVGKNPRIFTRVRRELCAYAKFKTSSYEIFFYLHPAVFLAHDSHVSPYFIYTAGLASEINSDTINGSSAAGRRFACEINVASPKQE